MVKLDQLATCFTYRLSTRDAKHPYPTYSKYPKNDLLEYATFVDH